MEAIIGRGWFHLNRRLLKDPVMLETKIRLGDEKLDNQHEPTLQTNSPIPESIITDKFTIVSEITSCPNLPSVISLDLNIYKGSAGEIATDYFQMIQNNDQVKDRPL